MGKLQRYFLTGLLTLLPIWLVWVVFKFVFAALSGLSQPLIRGERRRDGRGRDRRRRDWLGRRGSRGSLP